MKTKPESCKATNCDGGATPATCAACINRNAIALRGYALVQQIESLGCSPEWTKAVVAVGEFVEFAAAELEQATSTGHVEQQSKARQPE